MERSGPQAETGGGNGMENSEARRTTEEVSAAVADSWWQMVMLHGALEEDGSKYQAHLLSYEAPTYCGLLTAVFERTSASCGSEAEALGSR
jgi:hypothetical protein